MTILNDVEPFLSLFQAELPLSVFLYEKLKCIVTLLLERVCRPEVLKQTVRKLLCLDLGKDSNLLPEPSVKIGFGAEKALKKLKSTLQADVIRNFRKSAKRMIIGMIQKIFERSPLKYPLTLRISCLSPTQINAVPNEMLENRCNKLLELLVESDWITPPSADRAQNQYRLFINDDEVLKKKENFDVVQDRIDEVYLSLMEHSKYPDLEQMVKIVLILSHGNARVESGFSINEQVLETNMKENSLVAQRIVYGGVKKEGGVLQVNISKQMITDVKMAWRYARAAEEVNKEKQTAGDATRERRKRVGKEIKNMIAAKKLAVEAASKAASVYDAKIHELTETR